MGIYEKTGGAPAEPKTFAYKFSGNYGASTVAEIVAPSANTNGIELQIVTTMASSNGGSGFVAKSTTPPADAAYNDPNSLILSASVWAHAGKANVEYITIPAGLGLYFTASNNGVGACNYNIL